MRIAVVSIMVGCDWGGSEELWADLAQEALADGHEVALFLHRPMGPTPARVADLQSRGAQVFYRRAPLGGRLLRAPALYRAYARAARPYGPLLRFKPDAVYFSL